MYKNSINFFNPDNYCALISKLFLAFSSEVLIVQLMSLLFSGNFISVDEIVGAVQAKIVHCPTCVTTDPQLPQPRVGTPTEFLIR